MDCNYRQNDLIYDIGAHKGDDAAFYLAKGFRVISVEAHPTHAAAIASRFSSEIRDGRLVLIDKGIYTETGVVDFYAHEHDDWSSFVKTERFAIGTYETIQVNVISFEDLIHEFGVPYYLKVDIEGLDFAVLAHLPRLTVFPKYISFEHHNRSDTVFDDPKLRSKECLYILADAGYDCFKFVEQTAKNLHPLPDPPLEGRYVDYKFTGLMTGAFGEEAMGDWMSLSTLLELVEQTNRHWIPGCWYDFHARHHD